MRIPTLIVCIVILAAVCLVLWLAGRTSDDGAPGTERADIGSRLRAYLAEGRNYRIYIGWPPEAPTEWARVAGFDDECVRTVCGKRVRIEEVSSFVVAYPSGTLLDEENAFEPLPEGVTVPKRAGSPPSVKVPTRQELQRGRAYVQIWHEGISRGEDGKLYYSTTVKNISKLRLRVVKFCAFGRDGRLATITNDFFTAQDFEEWYGVDNDGWIKPGQAATDPHNYGGGSGFWAYYFVAEDGSNFVAGVDCPSRQ